MTTNLRMTKQGVRDLNYYGPRGPKAALDDKPANGPNEGSVETGAPGVTSAAPEAAAAIETAPAEPSRGDG